MPTFPLGNLDLTLEELQSGIIAFGPQAANAVVKPLFSHSLRALNAKKTTGNTDPFQKPGGLILDLDGSFSGWLLQEIEEAGRIDDVILLQLGGKHRYNLIDSNATPQENAEKLYHMVATLESGVSGVYRFVDVQFKMFLQDLSLLLDTVRPSGPVTIADYAAVLSGDMLNGWLEEANTLAHERMHRGAIHAGQMIRIQEAAKSVHSAFFLAVTKAQVMTRHAISLVAGWIHQNPETHRLFCNESTFSLREAIEEGKLVIFNGAGIENDDARRIAFILAFDLQRLQRLRIHHPKEWNPARSVYLVCPQYDEIVPAGSMEALDVRGITSFWKESNLSRTIGLLSCSDYERFRRSVGDPNFELALRQAIRWWVVLASQDRAAAELVEFLATASLDTKAYGLGSKLSALFKGSEAMFSADEFAKLSGKANDRNVPAAIYDGGFGKAPKPRCLRTSLSAR